MKTEIEKFNPCKEALIFRNQHENFQTAWENCPRGDWMLWIAKKLKVNDRKLTLAKALCAETVLHLMSDERSINAVRVAKKYGRYRASKEELNAAATYAAAVDAAADAAADAAYAAAVDADAAAADAVAAYAAAYTAADADAVAAYAAAYTAADAAAADSAAYVAAKEDNQAKTADICRKILTKSVLTKIKSHGSHGTNVRTSLSES